MPEKPFETTDKLPGRFSGHTSRMWDDVAKTILGELPGTWVIVPGLANVKSARSNAYAALGQRGIYPIQVAVRKGVMYIRRVVTL